MKSISMAVEQFGAIREATVGPDIQICTDVHTRLDPTYSIQLCRQLEEFKPFFVEDAVRSENPASRYRNVRRQTNVPLAAGEHWWSKWPFREVIEDDKHRLLPHRPLHRRRHHGNPQDHPLGRNPLHRHRPAQPAWARLNRRMRLRMHGVHQRRRPRDAPIVPAPSPPTSSLQQIEWEDGYAWCPDTPGMGVDMDLETTSAIATPRISD